VERVLHINLALHTKTKHPQYHKKKKRSRKEIREDKRQKTRDKKRDDKEKEGGYLLQLFSLYTCLQFLNFLCMLGMSYTSLFFVLVE
jgi:hypothetical protein